jgi:hypothetical protein
MLPATGPKPNAVPQYTQPMDQDLQLVTLRNADAINWMHPADADHRTDAKYHIASAELRAASAGPHDTQPANRDLQLARSQGADTARWIGRWNDGQRMGTGYWMNSDYQTHADDDAARQNHAVLQVATAWAAAVAVQSAAFHPQAPEPAHHHYQARPKTQLHRLPQHTHLRKPPSPAPAPPACPWNGTPTTTSRRTNGPDGEARAGPPPRDSTLHGAVRGRRTEACDSAVRVSCACDPRSLSSPRACDPVPGTLEALDGYTRTAHLRRHCVERSDPARC